MDASLSLHIQHPEPRPSVEDWVMNGGCVVGHNTVQHVTMLLMHVLHTWLKGSGNKLYERSTIHNIVGHCMQGYAVWERGWWQWIQVGRVKSHTTLRFAFPIVKQSNNGKWMEMSKQVLTVCYCKLSQDRLLHGREHLGQLLSQTLGTNCTSNRANLVLYSPPLLHSEYHVGYSIQSSLCWTGMEKSSFTPH